MKRSGFTEHQIIGILKEHQAGIGSKELCRKHGISDGMFYKWRSKLGSPLVGKREVTFQELLARHFPELPQCRLIDLAESLDFKRLIASVRQDLERRQSCAEDTKALSMIVKNLRRAELGVLKLGPFGGGLLRKLSKRLDRVELEFFCDEDQVSERTQIGTVQGNIEIFAAVLGVIHKDLSAALVAYERSIPELARGGKTGRPPETEARLIALHLHNVFEECTGTRPTAPTNRESDKKSGPFVDFLRDVFKFFELSASPEHWAREVCDPKSPKEN